MKVLNRRLFDAFGTRPESAVLAERAALAESLGGDVPPRTGEGKLWNTFFRFLRVILPYWDKALLIVGLICVNMVVSLLYPWVGKWLVDDCLPNRDWQLFWVVIIAGISLTLGQRFVSLPWRFFERYIDLWVLAELRARFFEHQARLSMTHMQSKPVGEHIFRASNDVNAVMFMITDLLPRLLESIFNFALVMVVLSYLDWRVAVTVVIFMVPYTAITHYVATLLRRWDKEHRIKNQKAMAVLQEGVAGKMVVKTFARRTHEVAKYIAAEIAAFRVGMKKRYAYIVKNHLVAGNGGLAPWLMNWAVKLWFYRLAVLGYMTYGSLLPVFSYMNRFRNPIQNIVNLLQTLRISMVPAERLMETLEMRPEVVTKPGAPGMPGIQGEVRLENVDFAYEEGVPILKDMNVTVEKGSKVAFVGHSGTGKSTIAKLVMRLYDPQAGRVLIDGVDVREVRLESVQRQLGLVFQETYLFIGTIRENVLFANPRATEEQIWAALREADLEEFVRSLPQGLDTDMQEGTSLSGGQKQRLGIARALVRDPNLLIMDEPTSSLDSDTEKRVMSTIRKATRGRTTIIISHRLPTIVDADVIHVIDDGRIVESGSHAELMSREGYYRDLYTLYFKGGAQGEAR